MGDLTQRPPPLLQKQHKPKRTKQSKQTNKQNKQTHKQTHKQTNKQTANKQTTNKQQTNKQTNNKGLLQICDSSGPGRSFLRNREVFKTYVCNMSPRRSKATPLLLTPARFLCSHSAHENMFAEHQFMLTTFPHFTRHIPQCDRFPSNVFYGND